MCAMCDSVLKCSDDAIASSLFGVEAHVGHSIDLWPDADNQDIDRQDAIRSQVTQMQSQFAASKLAIDAPSTNTIQTL